MICMGPVDSEQGLWGRQNMNYEPETASVSLSGKQDLRLWPWLCCCELVAPVMTRFVYLPSEIVSLGSKGYS